VHAEAFKMRPAAGHCVKASASARLGIEQRHNFWTNVTEYNGRSTITYVLRNRSILWIKAHYRLLDSYFNVDTSIRMCL